MTANFLLPDARFETCLVCYGDTGTGKSTIAEGIVSALGPDLVRQLGMSQICDPKGYHVPKLQGAAVSIGTELDSLEVAESSNFKAIVSGKPIETRAIYCEHSRCGPHASYGFSRTIFLGSGMEQKLSYAG